MAPSFGYDDYYDGLSHLPPVRSIPVYSQLQDCANDGQQSPLSFAGPSDFRFPNVADGGQLEAQPNAQIQAQSEYEPPSQSQSEPQPAIGYSKLFKMGLFSVSVWPFFGCDYALSLGVFACSFVLLVAGVP